MSNLLKLIMFAAFICLVLMAGPWCFIWAINTLAVAGGATGFFIPFTFYTWLASIILGAPTIFQFVRKN